MLKCYQVDAEGTPIGVYRDDDVMRPDRVLDSLVKQHQAAHHCDYVTAYRAVMTCPAHQSLREEYARLQWMR